MNRDCHHSNRKFAALAPGLSLVFAELWYIFRVRAEHNHVFMIVHYKNFKSMSPGKANEIRQVIRQAKQSTTALGRLRRAMLKGIPRLHRAIRLPDRDREVVLTDFVLRYLDHVPDYLDALRNLTRSTGIHAYTSRFLDTAADFFLKPVESPSAQRGLLVLMKRAYLAHRVLEELNDRILSRCGTPLVPVDMTRPNLLMHQLIGETHANELDRLVQVTVTACLDREHLMDSSAVQSFIKQQKTSYWRRALRQWPCLTEGFSIAISFTSPRAAINTSVSPAIH